HRACSKRHRPARAHRARSACEKEISICSYYRFRINGCRKTKAMINPPPRVLALANQKGGVGKTTTAINLGTALAAVGETVLIVALDPQGNASTGLGIDRKSRRRSTYDVLTKEIPVRDAIQETAVPRLHIVPSTMDLSGLELEIAHERDRAYRLRDTLATLNH